MRNNTVMSILCEEIINGSFKHPVQTHEVRMLVSDKRGRVVSRTVIHRALNRLKEANKIHRPFNGYWQEVEQPTKQLTN